VNVLVTGIAGFVGSSLASALVKGGNDIVGIIRDSRLVTPFKLLGLEGTVSIVYGDVTNQELVERVIMDYKVDTIFHLAANTIVASAQRAPAQAISNNFLGALSVLEAARVCGKIERLVIQATDKVYGHQGSPQTEDLPLLADEPYSGSKACCDILARIYHSTYGLPIVVTRPCNLYGPGDIQSRVIPNTVRTCIKDHDPIIFKKDDKREFLYIDDFIDALIFLVENIERTKYQVFNVGGDAIRNNEGVVLEILKSFPKLKPVYVEPTTGIREIPEQWPDFSKLRGLGWEPRVSFEDGIWRTVEWWRKGKTL